MLLFLYFFRKKWRKLAFELCNLELNEKEKEDLEKGISEQLKGNRSKEVKLKFKLSLAELFSSAAHCLEIACLKPWCFIHFYYCLSCRLDGPELVGSPLVGQSK